MIRLVSAGILPCDATAVTVRYVIDAHLEDGGRRVVYESAFIHQEGSWRIGSVREDLDLVQRNALANHPVPTVGFELSLQQRVEGTMNPPAVEWLACP